MILRSTLLAAGLALAAAAPAPAQELKPIEARRIALGEAAGIAYYTVEPEGYRVVVTLAVPDAAPLRLETRLAAGQSVLLSAPRGPDAPAEQIEISRRDDTVLVRRPGPVAIN
ncbi:hypothetical protein [Roseicella frigidaeris]|uniref:Uncharacterized protein n=1 Tax=Roseicella frigidaeris TaxID=2230885 RepID=A0A327M719_9PROT|nr:hypothetical protein [Roseicella frigidaeris]RAI58116.1 hypothetical protein DOO78_15410 [Roseicella frigidaeris]